MSIQCRKSRSCNDVCGYVLNDAASACAYAIKCVYACVCMRAQGTSAVVSVWVRSVGVGHEAEAAASRLAHSSSCAGWRR